MMEKTQTQERFEEVLKKFNNKLGKCELKIEDGRELFNYALNLYERYLEIRIRNKKWRARAEKAEKELKDLEKSNLEVEDGKRRK
jgi:hypothetical protein